MRIVGHRRRCSSTHCTVRRQSSACSGRRARAARRSTKQHTSWGLPLAAAPCAEDKDSIRLLSLSGPTAVPAESACSFAGFQDHSFGVGSLLVLESPSPCPHPLKSSASWPSHIAESLTCLTSRTALAHDPSLPCEEEALIIFLAACCGWAYKSVPAILLLWCKASHRHQAIEAVCCCCCTAFMA